MSNISIQFNSIHDSNTKVFFPSHFPLYFHCLFLHSRSSKKDGCSQTELPRESQSPPPSQNTSKTQHNTSTSSENFERQIRKLLDDQNLIRNNPGKSGPAGPPDGRYVSLDTIEAVQEMAKQQELELAWASSPVTVPERYVSV